MLKSVKVCRTAWFPNSTTLVCMYHTLQPAPVTHKSMHANAIPTARPAAEGESRTFQPRLAKSMNARRTTDQGIEDDTAVKEVSAKEPAKHRGPLKAMSFSASNPVRLLLLIYFAYFLASLLLPLSRLPCLLSFNFMWKLVDDKAYPCLTCTTGVGTAHPHPWAAGRQPQW